MFRSTTVGIAAAPEPWEYAAEPPFRPHETYPELQGRVRAAESRNVVYPLFRQLARDLGWGSGDYSSLDWNPLGTVIKPGQKVLVKPNLVRHCHVGGGDYQAVITHPSVVRCVLDYVALALQGRGVITVGDAPVQNTDFNHLVERTGLQKVCDDVERIWQIPVRLVDFRRSFTHFDADHRLVNCGDLDGDSAGSRSVDLGERSLLADLDSYSDRFRVTNYDCQAMAKHHGGKRHEYIVSQSVLDADVVLNLPKLKTHRKAGMTAALKNIVGINAHKDWLPHHRIGSIQDDGDEYCERSFLKRCLTYTHESIDKTPFSRINGLRRFVNRVLYRLIRLSVSNPYFEGSWYGNDTLWRTVLDLNRLLVYANREGKMSDVPQRRCLTIVDGVIAGEGEGPMEPDARPCGLLVGGDNPVAVDAVLATLIGFDYTKVPLIAEAFRIDHWPLVDFTPQDIEVLSEDSRVRSLRPGQPCGGFRFKASSGWAGHVELLSNGNAEALQPT